MKATQIIHGGKRAFTILPEGSDMAGVVNWQAQALSAERRLRQSQDAMLAACDWLRANHPMKAMEVLELNLH
jgi:hypothetical protein